MYQYSMDLDIKKKKKIVIKMFLTLKICCSVHEFKLFLNLCKLFLLSNNWTGCTIMSIKRSCVQVNVMCTSNSKCQPLMTYCNCILNNIMIDTFIYFLLSTTYSMPIQHMNSWDMWEVVLPLKCVILWCCTVIIFLLRSFFFSKPLLTK